jgi:23S rRNA (uracil1939-C5)-methyltransferase
VKAGEKLVLVAENLAFGGDCVGREPGGMVVFVPYLASGDEALVEITRVYSNHARGRALEVLRPGQDRVSPRCPVFGVCGGCHWQHVALEAQRSAKERIVRHLLEPFGLSGLVEPIRGLPDGYGYRNRLILPVRSGKRGGLSAGFFRAGTHSIVEIGSCAVQRPRLWDAARAALSLADSAGVSGYDESTGAGELRHLLVRCAAGTDELGVVFVTAGDAFPKGGAIARELVGRVDGVAGVVQNINPRRTNVILGTRTRVLAGRGHLVEKIGGLNIRASLPSFFQANAGVMEKMLDLIRGWSGGTCGGGGGGVLDLYCGAGVLGLVAAGASSLSWLVGVEESPEAVEDARANARALPALKARFVRGEVEEALPRLAADLGGLETVIADPPRRGMGPAALRALLGLGAVRMIYVSCDPATFARDLKVLLAGGFGLVTVVPFDMFPQTYHVELAALLERRPCQAGVQ